MPPYNLSIHIRPSADQLPSDALNMIREYVERTGPSMNVHGEVSTPRNAFNYDDGTLAAHPTTLMNTTDDDDYRLVTRDEAREEARAQAESAPLDTTEEWMPAFICPITLQPMLDPVLASDGHSYERRAIQRWLGEGRKTSPRTNLPIDGVLIDNEALRISIESWTKLTKCCTLVRKPEP